MPAILSAVALAKAEALAQAGVVYVFFCAIKFDKSLKCDILLIVGTWEVRIKTKTQKKMKKLPVVIQEKALALAVDLKNNGVNPGKKWHNFSGLGGDRYHCHLTYSYVACWEEVEGEIRLIEVYYVGSRENAPY